MSGGSVDDPAASSIFTDSLPARIGNVDVDWDQFDSDAYFSHNYGILRRDDEQIIDIVTEFFHDAAPHWSERAIDVGAGANLYPALTMLPFAAEVILYERAFSNRSWLTSELKNHHDSWWQFWDRIAVERAGRKEYAAIKEPFDLLHRRAKVVKGNIFSLRADKFDIGTMFFVAE